MGFIEKSNKALDTVQHHQGADFEKNGMEENIIDLLTDLRHLAHTEELDFDHLSAISYSNYCEEGGE